MGYVGREANNEWFVLQTRPQKERVVLGLLAHAGYEYFLPTIRGVGARVKPLFPRYCFVRSRFHDLQSHHEIRFTRGVTKILGDADGPFMVNHDTIKAMRCLTKNGSIIEQELLYKVGDAVRVKSGLLTDLIGIVEKNIPEQGRIQVLFKWLSRKMQATVEYQCLERVPTS